MGLLLVARALPAGKDDVVRKVMEAVTPTFLVRLLLPLSNQSVKERLILKYQEAGVEEAMRQVGMVTLGLAVIASMVRVPDIAQRKEIVSMLPSYLAVIEAGGVKRAIFGDRKDHNVSEIEIEAVNDAVECVWGVVVNGSSGNTVVDKNGCIVSAQECGALSSLLQGLDLVVCSINSRKGVITEGVQRYYDGILLMVRLVREMQSTAAESQLGKVYRSLSYVFALPYKLQSMGVDAKPSIACHLESLSALQTILFARAPPSSIMVIQVIQEDREASVHIQSGIRFLLQGKTSVGMKHGALLIAARMIEALGWEWYAEGDSPMGPFLQLLVEMARIETLVLLRDCLSYNVATGDDGQACDPLARLTLGTNEEEGKPIGSRVDAGASRINNPKQRESLRQAVDILPCCFVILESAVDLLIESESYYETNEAAGAIASRALSSVTEATESVLSLLESIDYNTIHNSFIQDIALGAVRLLGRFTAEMPLDIFQSRVIDSLPHLLSVSSSATKTACDDGVVFLLPLLLRATDVSERNEAWARALAQPTVLQTLVNSIQSMTVSSVVSDASMRVIEALCELMLQLGCQLEWLEKGPLELFLASCQPLVMELNRTGLTANEQVLWFLQFLNVKSQI